MYTPRLGERDRWTATGPVRLCWGRDMTHRLNCTNSWVELVRFWEETDWPESCKVEIVDGVVTVAPLASFRHGYITSEVTRSLCDVVPEDWYVFHRQATVVPSRRGLYIPDVVVFPKPAGRGSDYFVPAAAAELAVEITSEFNAHQDRISKAAGYAQAGVPLYLLIDSWDPGGPTATLYGEPNGDVYRVLHAVKFGEEITLPDPFNLTIETSTFPVS